MQVWFNTFFLYYQDLYKELKEISSLGYMEHDTNLKTFNWYLKTKDIDLAFKNKNIHSDLSIKFKFEINQSNIEQNIIKQSNDSTGNIDLSESFD